MSNDNTAVDNVMSIMVSEAVCVVHTKDSLKKRITEAMRITKHHRFGRDDDSKFKAALIAVMSTASEEEKKRIEKEVAALNALNALFGGVPVDTEKIEAPKNPLGLIQIWQSFE